MTKLTPLKSTSKNQNQARFWDSQSSFSGSSCLLVKIISGDVAGWGEAEKFDPTKTIAAKLNMCWQGELLANLSNQLF